MMGSRLLYVIIFCFFGSSTWAQDQLGGIEGVLLDDDGNAVVGAVVILNEQNEIKISGSEGEFYFASLKKGSYALAVSHLGFQDLIIPKIELQIGQQLNLGKLTLSRQTIKLSEVTVSPGSFSIMGRKNVASQTLSSKELENMTWAEDITRAVTRLPGISSNDFSSRFNVRGGEADEVLITLDGMELYEPFHQRDFVGGLSSIVDASVVESVDLYTGGFSAIYGQRQSAVFNMRTKVPQPSTKNTAFSLSLLNASAFHQSSFAKDKARLVISARRGILDLVLNALGETETVPAYYDAFAKLSYDLNEKQTVSFHTLIAGDKTAIRDEKPMNFDKNNTQYSNLYGWLTHKWAVTNKLFMRNIAYAGRIGHKRDGEFFKRDFTDKGEFFLKDDRTYNFLGIKQDWTIDFSSRFALLAGFDIRRVKTDYDYRFSLSEVRVTKNEELINYSDAYELKTTPTGALNNIYISAKYRLFDPLVIEAGMRYDVATYSDDKKWSPRASLSYYLSDRTTFRLAYGQYYQSQFINNLNVNYNADKFNPAEKSTHYVAGLEHRFSNKLYMRLEGYYKQIDNISPAYRNLRDPYEAFPEQRNDVVAIDFDGATAKGIEWMLKYDIGDKLSWWFSYSLAKAEENITNIAYDGIFIPKVGTRDKPLNQEHTIYMDFIYRLNAKWRFNLSWQYYNGLPLTTYEYAWKRMPDSDVRGQEAKQLFEDGDVHFYNVHHEYNGDQFPAYHRMDLRINKTFSVKKGELSAFLHIINLYNQFNMRKFDLGVEGPDEGLVPDGNGGYEVSVDHPGWFPLLPVFGISRNF